MAIHTVARYYSRWDVEQQSGRIALYGPSDNILDNRVYSEPEEFRLVIEMLKNERPLWFDDGAKHLRTGLSSSGEPDDQNATREEEACYE